MEERIEAELKESRLLCRGEKEKVEDRRGTGTRALLALLYFVGLVPHKKGTRKRAVVGLRD